ncbi:MAG: DUF4255 domain-containing protein [Oscillospiraceae bacterium]|nr:DUF4255 domain-containing protein [Oscillospiraceae bacterium]
MAEFSIISDAGTALLGLLRESLCPDPVISPESIILVSPSDKNSDYQLGLCMYDLRELTEYRSTTPLHTENNLRERPPKPLSLYYFLFMNNKAQIAAGAEMEQCIFGRAMQALMDAGTLTLSETNPYLSADEETASISLLNHSFEDKTKIWSALQSPYQVGIYFMVSPLLLSSRVKDPITRVTGAQVKTTLVSSPGVLTQY